MYREQVERVAEKIDTGYPLSKSEREFLIKLTRVTAALSEPFPPMDDGAYWYTETNGYTYLVYVKDNQCYSVRNEDGEPDTIKHVSEFHGEWEPV